MSSSTDLRIVVWSDRTTSMLSDLLPGASGFPEVSVRTATSADAEQMLRAGEVDVALLPSTLVLGSGQDFDVLPDVAVSTLFNPFASIHLPKGLECSSVIIPMGTGFGMPALLTAIVLQEGYGFPVERLDENTVDAQKKDSNQVAELTYGELMKDDTTGLDIGREWFELVNYPLVWALFVTRKGEATPELVDRVRELVIIVGESRNEWVDRNVTETAAAEFYRDALRYQFDDLVTASLTELGEYLYYYGEVSEIPDVSVASFTGEEDSHGW